MSLTPAPTASAPPAFPAEPRPDAVEAAVPYIPLVLPMVGAIMIFLLAMIAVYMA